LSVLQPPVFQNIAQRTQACANLASRARPVIEDALEANRDLALFETEVLRKACRKRKRATSRGGSYSKAATLVTPKPRSPSPERLLSDEDTAPLHMPLTLRIVMTPYLPKLPPKHTYLRTAPAPPKYRFPQSSALDRKLQNASLVQQSLKHLIESTEDKEGAGRDGDILGGVVNWEAHVHSGRKRWKVA